MERTWTRHAKELAWRDQVIVLPGVTWDQYVDQLGDLGSCHLGQDRSALPGVRHAREEIARRYSEQPIASVCGHFDAIGCRADR
ncbi:MAG TPA: hypothetical protein VFS15_22235, partial [Kofleriaceae bacterium]|nr:hypothetical protein [Kofleriaceae bacterium]